MSNITGGELQLIVILLMIGWMCVTAIKGAYGAYEQKPESEVKFMNCKWTNGETDNE